MFVIVGWGAVVVSRIWTFFPSIQIAESFLYRNNMIFGYWGLCWALRSCKGSCEVLWHPDDAGWERLQFKMRRWWLLWLRGRLCSACFFFFGGSWGWLNFYLAFPFWTYHLFPSLCDMGWWNFTAEVSNCWEPLQPARHGIGIILALESGAITQHDVACIIMFLSHHSATLGCLRFMNTCILLAYAQTSIHLWFIY